MRLTLLLPTLLALALGTASAEDTSTTPQTTFASSLKQLAASGLSITLLAMVDGQSTVVATVNPDGTLTITGDLQSATTVQVGDTTYTLAGKVTASGTLFVTVTTAQGKALTLPLIAAVHQTAAGAEPGANASKHDQGKPATTPDAAKATGVTAAAAGSGHAHTPTIPALPPQAPPAAGGYH